MGIPTCIAPAQRTNNKRGAKKNDSKVIQIQKDNHFAYKGANARRRETIQRQVETLPLPGIASQKVNRTRIHGVDYV